jgi:asparagine synthase (glutamine-hydrolysing)
MCGIFFFNDACYTEADYEAMKAAFEAGSGRGPEKSSLNYVPQIDSWIGFHRLAINGLTSDADQPLCLYDCKLICNGEIYNFKELARSLDIDLKTGSDCEIIIHLYKRFGIEHTLKQLDGVFSFILIDMRKEDIFVARDPFGVRPLYIGCNNSALCIASELIQVKTALSKYNTNVKYSQFAPGHWISLVTNNVNNTASRGFISWSISSVSNRYHMISISDAPRNYILGDLSRTLVSAVSKRVKNTERPVGCLLSGGLDSSLIAALVARESNCKINTYSIGMPGSVDLKHAQLVANHIGSNHHEFLLTEDDFFEMIPEVIERISSYDTTTVRASVGNYLLGSLISKNHDDIVIFNGDGADEVMGGYLYVQEAGNAIEFDKECRRLVDNIHHYDVLRSDRCISTHGLESRTPFLDKQFVDTYFRLPAEMRYESNCKHGEKYLLRQAIATSHPDLLPDQVLWRKKEAFSDGVSSNNKSWFEIIQEKLESKIMDFDAESNALKYPHNTPITKEQLYYRRLFETHYEGMSKIIPYFWMPKYVDAKDASARTLKLYNNATV